MARTVDQAIRQQLGNLLVEVTALGVEVEIRDEKIKELEAKLKEKEEK